MITKVYINSRLWNILNKNFRDELIYFNKSGIVNYTIKNFPLNKIQTSKLTNENFYFNDFNNYVYNGLSTGYSRNDSKTTFDLIISNNDTYEYRRIKNYIIDFYMSEFEMRNKSEDTLAVNYIIFHLLVDNGFIQLKEDKNKIENDSIMRNIDDNDINDGRINELEMYLDSEERIYLE